MEKILVTGFEPFGGELTNPSWEVASALPTTIAGHAVVCERIPVSFGRGPAAVLAAIQREDPSIVLCLGQAGGRAKVTPEFVGINYADARIPDNDGGQPRGARLLEDAPDAYFSTLPVHAMVQAMVDAGVPVAVSYTAGTYVLQRRALLGASCACEVPVHGACRLCARAVFAGAGVPPSGGNAQHARCAHAEGNRERP